MSVKFKESTRYKTVRAICVHNFKREGLDLETLQLNFQPPSAAFFREMTEREKDGKVELDVYRKATHTS